MRKVISFQLLSECSRISFLENVGGPMGVPAARDRERERSVTELCTQIWSKYMYIYSCLSRRLRGGRFDDVWVICHCVRGDRQHNLYRTRRQIGNQ